MMRLKIAILRRNLLHHHTTNYSQVIGSKVPTRRERSHPLKYCGGHPTSKDYASGNVARKEQRFRKVYFFPRYQQDRCLQCQASSIYRIHVSSGYSLMTTERRNCFLNHSLILTNIAFPPCNDVFSFLTGNHQTFRIIQPGAVFESEGLLVLGCKSPFAKPRERTMVRDKGGDDEDAFVEYRVPRDND